MLSLTWPVIIANLSLPLAGAVDTAVVGHLPDPVYIGAVALGALIFSTLYWLVGFLRMGTTGFVAQSEGANDANESVSAFIRGLGIAFFIAILILVLQSPISNGVFWFFDASQQVEAYALDYYGIRVWGVVFAMFNLVILGLLFGLQKMRLALVLQLILNGMNIILDVVFVMGFGWDVKGVASATVISEVLAASIGLAVCFRLLNFSHVRLHDLRIFHREKLRQLAEVNINIMIRTLCLEVVFIYFMWISAKQGDVVLAANAVLIHLMYFLAFGLDGFAHAAEALAGRAYGAKDRLRLHNTVVVTLYWSCIVAVGFSLFYGIAGGLIVSLITGITSVQQTAETYLIWLVIAPLVCVWAFLLDGVYIGMTRTVEMRNSMIISMLTFFATVHLGASSFGNHGLWLGILVFMAMRGIILGLWYRRIEARVDYAS